MVLPTRCKYILENPNEAKIIGKMKKMRLLVKNGTNGKKYTEGYLCIKFEEFILIYESMTAKKCVWTLLLAVTKVKVSPLRWNSNSTCSVPYWKYKPSFKFISQSILKKSPEWVDKHHQGIIRPFFKRMYKNDNYELLDYVMSHG